MLVIERLALRHLENEFKRLKLEKWEFYTQGPYKGDERGWKLPSSGQILKSDLPMYLDADKDLIALKEKIELGIQKADMLKSCIDQINSRQWNIKNAIDYMKFMNGINT